MAQIINIPRYIFMLIGYLSFLFGSGGLTFQVFAQPNSTGGIALFETVISLFLMGFGILLVFIATKLNKTKINENRVVN